MGSNITARVAKQADAADLGCEPWQLEPAAIEKIGPIDDPDYPEKGGVRTDQGQSWGNPVPAASVEDMVELMLAKALGQAADAARFDVVAQLTRELEARRLARGGAGSR